MRHKQDLHLLQRLHKRLHAVDNMPQDGLLGPTWARYWRVVSTHKTCLSPEVILISEVTDTTQVSIMAVARAPTWKPQAGSNGHHPCSCLH